MQHRLFELIVVFRTFAAGTPKDAVRFLSAATEFCAVLISCFAPRQFLTRGCLSLAALCPLMFVVLTAFWDMSHLPNFCDQFGWHCISHVPQCLAVLAGSVIGACRAKIIEGKVTSKGDVLLFLSFSLLLLMVVSYYNSARGWMMHLG